MFNWRNRVNNSKYYTNSKSLEHVEKFVLLGKMFMKDWEVNTEILRCANVIRMYFCLLLYMEMTFGYNRRTATKLWE